MACGGIFDIDALRNEITSSEQRMSEPGFWDRAEQARRTVESLKHGRRTVADWSARDEALTHLAGLLELAEGEGDERLLADVANELAGVERQIGDLELRSLLSGEHDTLGAIITIHP